jgi:hypothetical protein
MVVKSRFGVALAFAIITSFGASESFASSCLPTAGEDVSERRLNQANYRYAMDQFDKSPHDDEILFVYINKETKRPTGNSVFVPIPPGGRSVSIPDAVLGGLGPDVSVRIYHRNAGPLFILPYEKGSKETKPEDCVDAAKNERMVENRTIGLNCETVNLHAGTDALSHRLQKATIAYSSLAQACGTLVRHPEPPKDMRKKDNQKILADYDQAISSLKQFNQGIANRSPAIDGQAVHTGTKKTQDIGTPMRNGPGGSGKEKAKKAGGGN